MSGNKTLSAYDRAMFRIWSLDSSIRRNTYRIKEEEFDKGKPTKTHDESGVFDVNKVISDARAFFDFVCEDRHLDVVGTDNPTVVQFSVNQTKEDKE